jgi:FMN reductase [NAD(P)H]
MNDVIKTMLNHRSIRSYKSDMIKEEDLDLILKCAQAAPSSINGQQMSIILIKDQEMKQKMSEIAGGQPYVAQAPVFMVFCADFYRAKLAAEKNGVDFKIINNLEATLVGSVDVGLAMQNAAIAAESLGLGIVNIGGIRSNTLEVARLLNLPEYVFPICGLVVGYPNDPSATKPRLPKEAVIFEESYNHNLKSLIEGYDEQMSEYMSNRTNGKSNRNWSEGISNFYRHDSSRSIKKDMAEKGFKNE